MATSGYWIYDYQVIMNFELRNDIKVIWNMNKTLKDQKNAILKTSKQ